MREIVELLYQQLGITSYWSLKEKWPLFEERFRYFTIQCGIECPSFASLALDFLKE